MGHGPSRKKQHDPVYTYNKSCSNIFASTFSTTTIPSFSFDNNSSLHEARMYLWAGKDFRPTWKINEREDLK